MTRRYRFLSIVSLVLSLSVLLAPTPANANSTECLMRDSEFSFVVCQKGVCSPAFRFGRDRSGACSGRFVVRSIPEWAEEYFVTLIQKAAGPDPSGVYQIFVPDTVYHHPIVFADLLNHKEGAKIRVERLTGQSDISALRRQWQNRANWSVFWEWALYALDLGFPVLLWVLYRSALRYVHAIRFFFLPTHPVRKLWKPLLIQVGLFLIGTGVTSFGTGYGTVFFIIFLAPAVFLVWLFEGGMYVHLWYRRFMRLRGTI